VQLITLDFETYYASDFSLSSKALTTSLYIRDPRFKVHGVAVKIGTRKTRWVHGEKNIKAALDAIDWSKAALLAHNTAFDGAILAWCYNHIAAFYYDTLSMTRALHNDVSRAKLDVIMQLYGVGEKSKTYLTPTKGLVDLPENIMKGLGDGAIIDVQGCYDIFQQQIKIYPKSELALIDLTMRMFIEPQFVVNKEVAERALAEEERERQFLILGSGQHEKTLSSNPKFAECLKALGVDPPMKYSVKQEKMVYALSQTDEDFLELLGHEDRRVVRLVAGRLAAKATLFDRRGRRLIADGTGGFKLPVLLNYFGAKTGRWSGGNKTNMQNLPRLERDDSGVIIESGTGMLRLSIEAPKGHYICVVDSSQIEARTIAVFSKQDDITKLFADGEDVYCYMASIIYGRRITKKDKLQRFVGKVAVLALGYGMGWKKFQTTLALGIMGPAVELDDATCKGIVNSYRKANHMIEAAWREADTVLECMLAGGSGEWNCVSFDSETIWLPNGMPLNYPDLQVSYETGESYETRRPYKTGSAVGIGARVEKEIGWVGNKKVVRQWVVETRHRVKKVITYLAHGKRKKIYGPLLLENIIQALARIIVSDQMLQVDTWLKKQSLRPNQTAQITLMTHDEIVVIAPKQLAEKCVKAMLELMKKRPSWMVDIPLDAEGGFAVRYEK
jgi:DNA polymerase